MSRQVAMRSAYKLLGNNYFKALGNRDKRQDSVATDVTGDGRLLNVYNNCEKDTRGLFLDTTCVNRFWIVSGGYVNRVILLIHHETVIAENF